MKTNLQTPSDPARGTGRTTGQILAAPQGAFFVWCQDNATYARDLAVKHGRDDLRVVGADSLRDGMLRFSGLKNVAVVVDHAAEMTREQVELLYFVNQGSRARV